MSDPLLEFDPASESSGSPLTITTGNFGLVSFSYPSPPARVQFASSADTEGSSVVSANHENRTITIGLEVATDASLAILQGKLAKAHREGATLKYTTTAGVSCIFDVLVQDGYEPQFDHLYLLGGVASVQFTLTCKPYARGAEVTLSDHVETSLPVLIFTEASVAGDVPALGRLVIDEDQGVSQWWMTWGLESKNYSSSANAALFYEAEGRTALGGSATAVGPSGASGAGSNVMRNTALPADYIAILSTQATAAGAHLSHVGSFHAYMRVQVPTANTGLVTVALEWSEADFLRYTRNAATTIPSAHEGQWRLVDLGIVTTTSVLSGVQRWEGRIVAKSTVVGDDIDIDYLFLVPVAEGSGIASGVARSFTPTAFAAEDHFTATTAGVALNARVAPTGGTWATSGDATDFLFADDLGGEQCKRSAASGTSGRFGILGSTNYTAAVVSCSIALDSGATTGWPQPGVIARWVDASNHLRAVIYRDSSSPAPFRTYLEIHQLLAGVKTVVAQSVTTSVGSGSFSGSVWKVDLAVDVGGHATATMTATGATGTSGSPLPAGTVALTASASIAAAATGGTLATGKPGIFDLQTGATPTILRYWDDFLVASLPVDAAAFASQSIEVRSDRVRREDSGGTMWSKPSSYVGDYLLVPPSGAEARTNRVIVKMSRNDPFELDSGIDDLSARLLVTPRFLALPG